MNGIQSCLVLKVSFTFKLQIMNKLNMENEAFQNASFELSHFQMWCWVADVLRHVIFIKILTGEDT